MRIHKLKEALQHDIQTYFLENHSHVTDWRADAAYRLTDEFSKKFVSNRDSAAKTAAIETWRSSNANCGRSFEAPFPKSVNTTTDWGNGVPDVEEDSLLPLAYGIAKDFFRSLVINQKAGSGQDLFSSIKPEDGRFGPGKTLGCKYESMFFKLKECPHSMTHLGLKAFYRKSLLENPRSFQLEIERYRKYGQIITDASKLTTVPKKDTIDRVICIEPLLNMFYQQAVRGFLERRLRTVGIDFAKQQTIQRQLAKRGSIDGSLVTIDLSSASDTISLNFCKNFIPEALLYELEYCRTKFTMIGDEKVELNMISSMGNATTFPLQTMIFLSLVVGVMRACGSEPIFRGNNRNIGVFGDDIILPRAYALLLCELLEKCGFRVNTHKSFIVGRFRESCGGDYFAGMAVTPVRIKNLNSLGDYFSCYNRLLLWSSHTGIPLSNSIRLVRSWVSKPLFVPVGDDIDSGFWSDIRIGALYKKRVPVSRVISADACIATFLAGCVAQNEDLSCTTYLKGTARTRLIEQRYLGFTSEPKFPCAATKPAFSWVSGFLETSNLLPSIPIDGIDLERIRITLSELDL